MYISAETRLTLMGLTLALLCHTENSAVAEDLSFAASGRQTRQSCEVQVKTTHIFLGSTNTLQEPGYSIS